MLLRRGRINFKLSSSRPSLAGKTDSVHNQLDGLGECDPVMFQHKFVIGRADGTEVLYEFLLILFIIEVTVYDANLKAESALFKTANPDF